jgi:hypothetical protein
MLVPEPEGIEVANRPSRDVLQRDQASILRSKNPRQVVLEIIYNCFIAEKEEQDHLILRAANLAKAIEKRLWRKCKGNLRDYTNKETLAKRITKAQHKVEKKPRKRS